MGEMRYWEEPLDGWTPPPPWGSGPLQLKRGLDYRNPTRRKPGEVQTRHTGNSGWTACPPAWERHARGARHTSASAAMQRRSHVPTQIACWDADPSSRCRGRSSAQLRRCTNKSANKQVNKQCPSPVVSTFQGGLGLDFPT